MKIPGLVTVNPAKGNQKNHAGNISSSNKKPVQMHRPEFLCSVFLIIQG